MAMIDWTNRHIGDSFCSLWIWLHGLAAERHGPDPVNLSYIQLRDGEIDAVLAHVREACARLQAAELFGPDDDTLLATGGPNGIRKPGFASSVPARPAEIRLALVLRHCERYVFERSEVCPAWVLPFPTEPVTSVAALTQFLVGQIDRWSQAESHSSGATPPDSKEEWRVLDNVLHTLAWFRSRELIRSVPNVPALKRTKLNAGRCAEILRQWLNELVQSPGTSPSNADGQDDSARRVCCVVLRSKGDKPLVHGREVPSVTSAQYDVLRALIGAGADGLSLTELSKRSGHGSARNVLGNLASKSSVWKQVILLPGAPGRRYRLLFK